MNSQEFHKRKQELEETLLSLASKMAQSDAHALKCHKLGLVFSEEYPEEYKAYAEARLAYNEAETALSALKAEGYEEESLNLEMYAIIEE